MMKTIDKMTDQEIYDLTDEQVEKLIVIKCAEEGVRFIDEPPIMKTYDYKPIFSITFLLLFRRFEYSRS